MTIEAPYRIGELSARTGRSVHTIRWYETQGLLPGVERDGGGRRVYRPEHADWLDLVDRLRRTGMSIAEIRRYAALSMRGRSTVKERRNMLKAHRARVLTTIAEWGSALELIDRKLEFYADWLATGRRPKETPLLPARQSRRPERAPPRAARMTR